MTRNRAGNFGIDESVPLDAATKSLKNELEKEKENVKKRDQTIIKLEGDKQKQKDLIERLNMESKAHGDTLKRENLGQ